MSETKAYAPPIVTAKAKVGRILSKPPDAPMPLGSRTWFTVVLQIQLDGESSTDDLLALQGNGECRLTLAGQQTKWG